ncbi:hypothetical protein SFR_2389 [Streptomyces sp. FR-008]|nr:hypothetical protein SFR_2389 [Streptomyces sp. FR-008]
MPRVSLASFRRGVKAVPYVMSGIRRLGGVRVW